MIREIKYIVGQEKEITPAKRQWAGMQFEDNATEVVFQIGALGIENALYRIDFNSAGAGYQPGENLIPEATETVELSGVTEIKRSIPKVVTQYGGEVQVTAVITVLDESGNETGTCYSYPAIIYFTDVDKDAEGSLEVEKNISAAEASALSAASRAEQSAREAAESEEAAELAQEKTEAARFALEEGAEFVFQGGDSTGSAEVELVIDDELSEASSNPVQNRVITAEFAEVRAGAAHNGEEIKLLKAETEQNRQDISVAVLSAEQRANKVISVDESSTDEQYPSARLVYGLENRIGALEGLAVKRTLINAASGVTSLMKWCNENVREGVQIIQIGAGITDLPGSSSSLVQALYICNDISDNGVNGRRTLILPAMNGKLYIRVYIKGNNEADYPGWRSWYLYGGTEVTVANEDESIIGG